MPIVYRILLPLMMTALCITAAAQSDWDVLQTTKFRPAVDAYAPPYPIRHPANLAVCRTIIQKHQAEKDRLGREHQECLDGFHAPPRKPGMRKEDCSIHVCQVLHTQELYANSENDDRVARQYESDCIASFKEDHPSRPQSTVVRKPSDKPTQSQGTFLDDPVPPSTSGSKQKDSVAEQLAAQHEKNLDSSKPSPPYTASYTPSPTGPYAQKQAQPGGQTWGYCEVSSWVLPQPRTNYLTKVFLLGDTETENQKLALKQYVRDRYHTSALFDDYCSTYPSLTDAQNAVDSITVNPNNRNVLLSWP
jgi:hypothetical protein